MPLINAQGCPLPDPWCLISDQEEIPQTGAIVVPIRRWCAERERLIARQARTGLVLKSGEGLTEILPDLAHIHLIALEFPKFTDGRHYSTARLLRERHGYKGELRAVGAVLLDQLEFLQRCGFDTFVLVKEDAGEAVPGAFRKFSVVYQPAADERIRAGELRKVDRTNPEQSRICVGSCAY